MESLHRRVGREDRQALAAYLTVLRESKVRIKKPHNSPAPHFEVKKPERPALANNMNEQGESILDLIALALSL